MYKKSITDKHRKPLTIRCSTVCLKKWKRFEELPERFRDKAVLKYIENYSLSGEALREGKRLGRMEKALEGRSESGRGESQKKRASERQYSGKKHPLLRKTKKTARQKYRNYGRNTGSREHYRSTGRDLDTFLTSVYAAPEETDHGSERIPDPQQHSVWKGGIKHGSSKQSCKQTDKKQHGKRICPRKQ